MGALPKRRISTGRRGRRRSAIKLGLPKLTPCPACGQPKKSHQTCPHCGEYKQKTVIRQKVKKEDSQKKRK